MNIANLSPATLARLIVKRYDRIIEKHEGPETWKWRLQDPDEQTQDMMRRHYDDYDPVAERADFLSIGGQWVLLPIGRKHHSHLTILHHFLSQDEQKMVIYLQDKTYDEGDHWSSSGYVAICDCWTDTAEPEPFFVATFYHEWFIIDYTEEARRLFG